MPNSVHPAALEQPRANIDVDLDVEAPAPAVPLSADRRVRDLVAARPVLALLGAVAVGFVVGRLLSRRSRGDRDV
jgi:hypothetical protein